VLRFAVIGETAALVVAVVTYLPRCTCMLWLQKEGSVQLSEAFKEEHAAKSAAESKHSNHNIRAHLGKIYKNNNNQSSSFPNNNKS
jgi:hypothetical protein